MVTDFVGEYGVPTALEPEDLTQEVLAHWWLKRQRHAEERGASLATYLRRIARTKLLDIARRTRADKRGGGLEPRSLDATVGSTADLTLADIIEDRRAGIQPDAAVQLDALRQHIVSVERRLTPRQRSLLEALRDQTPLTELSRRFGVNRSTVYADLARLRELFQDEGLEEFL